MLINFGRVWQRRAQRARKSWIGNAQVLETRALLAGTVLVTVSAAGDITITGDNKDNQIGLDVTPDGVFVYSEDNRTKIKVNGENLGVVDEGQLIAEDGSEIRSIRIDMKNGDDYVDLNFIGGEGGLSVDIANNIDVKLGNGDDEFDFDLDGDVSVTIGGNFKIDTGTGSDIVDIDDDSFVDTLVVNGLLEILTGSGSDAIFATFQDFTAGNVKIDTGADSDYIEIEFEGAAVIEGALTVSTGNEDDAVALTVDPEGGSLTVDGNATISLGTDDDVLLLGDQEALAVLQGFEEPTQMEEGDLLFHVDGDLSISGSSGDDVIAIGGVSTGRDLRVNSGADDDVIGALGLIAGRDLDVRGENGNDLIAAEEVLVQRNTKVDAGSGHDAVAVTGVTTGNATNSRIEILMGTGNDDLAIGTVTLGEGVGNRVTINGGSGADDIASDTDLGDDNIATGAPVFGFEDTVADGEDITDDVIDAINDAIDDEFFFFV